LGAFIQRRTAAVGTLALAGRHRLDLYLRERMARRREPGATPITIFFPRGRRWTALQPLGAATLGAEGRLTAPRGRNAGVVLGPFPIERGGLIRARIDVAIDQADRPLILSLRDDQDRPIAPEQTLASGRNVVVAYAAQNTSSITARLTFRFGPASLRLASFALDHKDPDMHYREARAQRTAETIASLASIPSRSAMLADTVGSLLPQADRIRVFLNGYGDIPEFLNHERIEVRRSQDWDDHGDAGKFAWIGADDTPGYRIICDDDLIYAPDFVPVMTRTVASHGNRAIVGGHGILLRQPLASYYEPTSRARTFHFAYKLAQERTVHILGTNALCFHSSAVRMGWQDFLYRNSADIWLALYAQRQKLPMIVPPRAAAWIRENPQAAERETIYRHSLEKSGSPFDTSAVQTAALKRAWPLTLQPSPRPKIVFCVLAGSAERLPALVTSWAKTLSLDFDWALLLAPMGAETDKDRIAGAIAADHETHFLPRRETPAEQIAGAVAFAVSLEPRYLLIASDRMWFENAGWDNEIAETLAAAGVGASLLLGGPDGGAGSDRTQPVPLCLAWRADPAGPRFTPTSLEAEAGTLLTKDAGFPDGAATDMGALPGFKRVLLPPSAAEPAVPPSDRAAAARPAGGLNGFFDRIVYINLDRRDDRRRAMEATLAAHGVRATRFPAVDGQSPEVQAEYATYASSPLRQVSAALTPLNGNADFYFRYDSQASRVAMQEKKAGGKAIRSAGAWAYLKSWERILESAINDGLESLLVLDDDVLLHRDMDTIFRRAIEELPPDWLTLRLGTLQYHWTAPWAEWHSPTLYRTNGCAVGSHAVGLRFEAMIYLLERVKMMEMPFDIGALSAITRDFADRCFVIYPNIAIQSLSDSDIGTSDYQKSRSIEDIAATYRWQLEDYRSPRSEVR
jgi:GR25 family glycosyltransferase involved in LPS biosynthesis